MNYSTLIAALLLLLIIGGVVIGRWIRRNQSERTYDRVINETNYNISTYDDEKLEAMTPEEAKVFLKKVQESDLSTLSHRDFFKLKAKIEQYA